ncbi:(5R,7aS)-5-hydroxy-7a-methyl-1-oxo-2,3,5,6,7,7a-hexahydro-1H-indene-carboxyl-CoA reductase-like [Phymastichus coffea]|uniref:(5R,7aS)-5-hydroxy-7a-methyl-1-oxo-2,3,5,6,7, 7a-hexahydro-1H-indene-carboxyl-CoA reductase-like n=1 Tax=Phymastichus coffea TaxID=108790 RepID=UPI00273C0B68|nr:(5R,7aS)-5-hydroxy-7a-methyl-1-oxo-2,3,5,6,7,7a-hexahydro-1H-indene-carboxyl-CoA reductase-like [Phymastichus coffea]
MTRGKAAAASSPRIVVPGNCREHIPPIMSAECRVAVVVGGCSDSGLGLVAAERLLHHGAKRVILADASGASAAERLCAAYGKGRAKFYPCDPKNSCQVEGIFECSHCREENVSILVNDLDAIQRLPDSPMNSCPGDTKHSNAKRITKIALEVMPRKCKSSGGIIVNCASILGFMGWPDNPQPVYCGSEPVIETSLRLAASFPVEQTGIRLVALCPSNRSFEAIGLPDMPDSATMRDEASPCQTRSCTPDPRRDRSRVGHALAHLTARAPTGTAWLIEPPFTAREQPQLLLPRSTNAEECSIAQTLDSPPTRDVQCSCKS